MDGDVMLPGLDRKPSEAGHRAAAVIGGCKLRYVLFTSSGCGLV
jgi:hypothetical protein